MKPKIFISSTIYDFRDLRSALKFYFEQFDFSVQLSEFNDFQKKLDLNSYDSCLNEIHNSDYFILLIGSRVGGWFDEINKISITRKEYETAYELAREGKLKLLIFVRDEIWTIREDRKALKKYLQSEKTFSSELSASDMIKITNYPSNLINDANLIFNFIKDVCRIDEMKDATKSKSEFPKNNWVHTFKYFHDIIDVINNEFKLNTPLEELVLKHNLKIELLENIKTLLSKYGSGIDKSNLWAKFCREKVSNGLDDVSHLPFKYIKWLSMFAWVLPGKQHYLRRHFIEKSISSGIFLRFSRDKNTYEDTEISKYLSVLKDQMERYFRLASFASDQNVKFFEKYDFNKSTPNDQIVPIKNMDILSFLALHDCEEDIINISKAMYQYLGNNINTFENIKLSPRTPFEDENVKIENESLSDDEVITWINEN